MFSGNAEAKINANHNVNPKYAQQMQMKADSMEQELNKLNGVVFEGQSNEDGGTIQIIANNGSYTMNVNGKKVRLGTITDANGLYSVLRFQSGAAISIYSDGAIGVANLNSRGPVISGGSYSANDAGTVFEPTKPSSLVKTFLKYMK